MFTSAIGLLHKITKRDANPTKINFEKAGNVGATNGAPAVDDSEELIGYICQSPLMAACGITREDVERDIQAWKSFGNHCIENLALPAYEHLPEAAKNRIFQYYLPVFFWCRSQLAHHRSSSAQGGPLVIGISAPQGCGKSTLCEQLESLFAFEDRTAVAISIDDFYLTYDGQNKRSQEHAGNPLLEMRGNAGSHDLQLGEETLKNLQDALSKFGSVTVPRYDKSAYSGRGDRAPQSAWPKVNGPVDVVLFEGWMLGFAPVGAAAAGKVDPNLVAVDKYLESYKAAWDKYCDCWLVVRVKDPQYAYRWRLQAEQAMRARGSPAMTDEQVKQFVDRFMPAYKCYLSGLYSKGPTTAQSGKLLVVEVDETRSPVDKQPNALM